MFLNQVFWQRLVALVGCGLVLVGGGCSPDTDKLQACTDEQAGVREVPCIDGVACVNDSECVSGICEDGECVGSSCSNKKKDKGETDTDCGGDTPCQRCDEEDSCALDSDCKSTTVCIDLVCVSRCENGKQDGKETGVDCGGTDCHSCVELCGNGRRDGDEIGRDCGGSCAPCSELCSNAAQDGDETGEDCGGSCAGCGANVACALSDDCLSHSCVSELCEPGCTDLEKNQGETGVDCGGDTTCDRCGLGVGCTESTDCEDGAICISKKCAPDLCNNDEQDAGETDKDCGGDCAPCELDDQCVIDQDCVSENCDAGTCAPSCTDDVKNQGETDTDCGGDNCDGCEVGEDCEAAADCLSDSCKPATGAAAEDSVTGFVCAFVPPCENTKQDGNETGIDCGGDDCGACEIDDGCIEDEDCVTLSCVDLKCASSCTDDLLDGDETAKDCGGPCAPERRCATDEACDVAADCVSYLCTNMKCAAEDPIDADDLIDDFEHTGSTSPVVGDRGGTDWVLHVDMDNGTVTPTGAPGTSLIEFGRGTSQRAVHFAGSGFVGDSWGVAMFLDVVSKTEAWDASAYEGIAFWAKTAIAGGSVRVMFPDVVTQAGFGVCDNPDLNNDGGPGIACDDWHRVRVPLTTEWARYKVKFSQGKQDHWGSVQSEFVDVSQLVAVRFAAYLEDSTFDLWIDDVAFYKANP